MTATPAPTEDKVMIPVPGITVLEPGQVPAEVLNVCSLFGPNDYKAWQVFATWEACPRVIIAADQPLSSGQNDGVREEHANEYRAIAAAAPAGEPVGYRGERLDPFADEYREMDDDAHVIAYQGVWYLLDGHHRVAGARLEGRATYGRLFDLDARAAAVAASEPVVLDDDEARFWHMVEGQHENDNVMVSEDDSDEDVFEAHDELHAMYGISDHRH